MVRVSSICNLIEHFALLSTQSRETLGQCLQSLSLSSAQYRRAVQNWFDKDILSTALRLPSTSNSQLFGQISKRSEIPEGQMQFSDTSRQINSILYRSVDKLKCDRCTCLQRLATGIIPCTGWYLRQPEPNPGHVEAKEKMQSKILVAKKTKEKHTICIN